MSVDNATIKADILSSLRKDTSSIIREELKSALAEDFESLKREIEDVKTKIADNTAAICTEIKHVKANMKDVEVGLSAWSDEAVSVQTTVADPRKQVDELKEKCKDMEGRMRRGKSSPTAVSKLLKEVLQMDREVLIQGSHLTQRKRGDKPCVIIAKLHNEGNAMDNPRKARDRGGQFNFNGNTIAIFPDYTSNVARARVAFTPIRKMLRGKQSATVYYTQLG